MSDKLNRFVDLMKSTFELDKSDLDFGIYRIMNIRKDEIEKFLAEGLPKKVQDTLAPFASNIEDIEKRIGEIEKQCTDLGIEISASPKLAEEYSRLKSQLTVGVDISALETDVYSALFSFFNRYYDEGDFISKRRYKEGVYAIPYEGEEVKLYWANQDQYFIKTAENFKDYTFIDEGRKVHFRLVEATTEQNNNKESDAKKRKFMLYEEIDEKPELKTMEVINGELYIRFVFDVPADKKIKYSEENYKRMSATIASQFKDWFSLLRPTATKDPKKVKTVLEKHLEGYVAKNTFDYFIHKDLCGFLTRELDFYIKSEVIHLDDLDTTDEKRVETYLAKVKAIKRVGKIIIDFLAQIEDFQKKLWLKKKFVISTDWCITLDNIDEAFYEEIIKNKTQVQEWINMYAINEIEGDLTTVAYSEPLTMDFLRQNWNLLVDTKHFATDFKERLIASIDNLDKRINGVMVQSENFQALKVMEERYKEKVKLTYIDPPYNNNGDGFLYKDNFKSSSWLCMMNDRLIEGMKLLLKEGLNYTSIGNDEEGNLRKLLDSLFTQQSIPYQWKSRAKPTNAGEAIYRPQIVGEFIYQNSLNKDIKYNPLSSGEDRKYPNEDEGGKYRTTTILTSNLGRYRRETMRFEIAGYAPPEDKRWKAGESEIQHLFDTNRLGFNSEGEPFRKHYEGDEEERHIPLWTFIPEDIAGTAETGKAELSDILGKTHGIDTVKPKELVSIFLNAATNNEALILDYFAGTGTTGHAVIDLNREDSGNRKYILVEVGEYFNTVTMPRVKKVVYSANWKEGKPANRNTGASHTIKYFKLESYEDALSNIKLSEEKHRMAALFGDEYLINYMLDVEAKGSLLDLDRFKMPFSYKMKISENNETKEKVIDLCETFNYLIGLSITRQSAMSYFKAETDKDGMYEGAVKLIEDIDGQFAFKQIEGTLPDGRRALIIWRIITDNLIESNAALDAYFNKHCINPLDRRFDTIYVNGDNNLGNLKTDDEHWKVNMIEPEFKQRMFKEV